GKVETVLADSGFNGAGTITVAAKRDIELLAPEGRTLPGETATHKQSDKQIPKGEFRYEAASDSYRCPAGHSLHRLAACSEYAVYGGAPCADCPMRARCTKGAEGRQIKRYPCDAAKEAMRATLADPAGRATTSARAWSSRCSPTSKRTRGCAASVAAAWPRCAWSSCCIWPPTTC